MPYIANTDGERTDMLATIGLKNMEELFRDLPNAYTFPTVNLPPAASEPEVLAELKALSERNSSSDRFLWFLGAGAYRHFIPSVVPFLQSRGEFATSYTPYQPEASQGTLQAIFEYQSMMCELLGMDATNASHYDGATALAEAVLMAVNVSNGTRKRALLSPRVHPEYKEVVSTYVQGAGIEIAVQNEGKGLAEQLGESTACYVVQYPNFFGEIEDLSGIAETVHASGALFVVHADPFSLGMLKPPGAFGVDIATAEGQSLGTPMSFGGPFLGVFATTSGLVRKMPGRLVGQTVDREGKRGFVLTLNTREQHIRREKATSNICTNQGLVALAAAIYLSVMGRNGLRKAAELCFRKAHYAARSIASVPGFSCADRFPFFKEFVVSCPCDASALFDSLAQKGIIAGLPLERYFPERKRDLLVCVTELNTKDEIDALVSALKEAV